MDIVDELKSIANLSLTTTSYNDRDEALEKLAVYRAAVEIERLRELFKTQSTSHAEHVKSMIQQHEKERDIISAYAAKLRVMVRDAYNSGFIEGGKEYTSSRGGIPWSDSKFRKEID